jgi:hypothetical protein
MRTTVTLDDDVAQLLENDMRRRDVSFKVALNEAVRIALGSREKPFVQRTFDMGKPKRDLTKALQLAGELEDEEILRVLRSSE